MTTGKYEGLYYVDKDFLEVMVHRETGVEVLSHEVPYCSVNEYDFDEIRTMDNYEDFITNLKESVCRRFSSFEDTFEFSGVILENQLFKIEIEDNENSYAVKLIQNEADDYCPSIENLQLYHHKAYLKGLKEALFEQFSQLGVYAGPYTSGTIYRNEEETSCC